MASRAKPVDAQCGKRAPLCKRDAAFIFFFGRSVSVFVFLILFIQVEVQLGLILATHPLTNSMGHGHSPFAFDGFVAVITRREQWSRPQRPPVSGTGELSVWALRLEMCVYFPPALTR